MAKVNNDKISVEIDVKTAKAQEEIHKLNKATKELQQQNNAHRKTISELAAKEGDYSKEIAKLNQQITDNSAKIRENNREAAKWEKEIDVSGKTLKQLRKELKTAKSEFESTSQKLHPEKYKELQQRVMDLSQRIKEAETSTKGFGKSLSRLDKVKEIATGALFTIGAAIMEHVVGAFKNAFNIIVDFDRENAKLAGILGTTREGIKEMTDAARQLGATTSFSATQVTQLQVELAKLGFSKEQILDMEAGILKFSKAVDTDLASASAFAGAALRIFNKDAKDTEDVLATFAIATTKTSLDFEKLQASLATIGPIANSFGLGVADTTALLGQLANAGFDASSAATATRNILLNLCDANGALAQALGQPVTNLDELAAGLQKLNAEGVDLAKALELTDKRSVAAFQTFLDQSGSLIELRDSITDVTGEFNQMSETMGDTVAGRLAGMQSAAEGLILKFFDVKEALKVVCEWITEVINWVGMLVDGLSGLGAVIVYVSKAVGAVIGLLGSFVGWLTKLTTQTKLGRAMLSGIVTALIAYKVATLAAVAAQKLSLAGMKDAIKTGLLFVKTIGQKVAALFTDAAANVKAAIATRTFNAALMANPIMLVVGLIAMLVAAIIGYNSVTDDASEATEKLNATQRKQLELQQEIAAGRKKLAENIDTEKKKLQDLQAVAEDENRSREERIKAVNELNRICPAYNGHLSGERGQLVANKKALDDYIISLERQMRVKYYAEEYEKYLIAQTEAQRALNKAKKDQAVLEADARMEMASWAQTSVGMTVDVEPRIKMPTLQETFIAGLEKDVADRTRDIELFKEEMAELGISFTDLIVESNNAAGTVEGLGGSMNKTAGATTSVVDQLKTLRAELKKLRKQEASDDDEYKRIQARKKELQERIKELEGKAKSKSKRNKREPGTYGADSLDEATASADDLHQQNMLEINKQKGILTNAEFVIAKNKEIIRYSKDLMTALETLRKNTDKSHTQTLDKITAEENKILQNVLTAQQAIDKSNVQIMTDTHKKRLDDLTDYSELLKARYQSDVNAGKMHSDEMAVMQLGADMQLHKDQLAELERYYREVEQCDLLGEAQKKQMLDKTAVDIRNAWSKVLTDTGKWQEKLRAMSTDSSSLEGLKATVDYQIEGVRKTYDAVIKMAREKGEDITGLEAQKNRRIEALNYQYLEGQYSAQETAGLSWSQEYDRELAKLQHMHSQGLISEKQFQQARLQLQVNNVKKYFDYYSQLAGSMVSAIQEAEIAQVEAKYDVLIQQAKNNGEDTAALEEEKENKKLEIQKKYADLDFAVKISQIIASTAVAIMQAFAQLGPIGGAIAAAMLTATGAAQVVMAKAERDKVKNMSPSKTASKSSAPATAERALSGYAEGGYTGDGDRYEVAGVVHRGEYVVPQPIMDNPRVVDAVGTIEAIRRSRGGGQSASSTGNHDGFAEGGYTSRAASGQVSDGGDLLAAVKELRAAVANIRAYVVLKDIEKAQETLDRSRSPFTRSK